MLFVSKKHPVNLNSGKGQTISLILTLSRGHWFDNRVNEGGNEPGSCEPMSDKQTRHVHVKVLEKKMPALLCNGAMFWLITGIDSHFMIRRQVEVIVVIYFKPIKCEI